MQRSCPCLFARRAVHTPTPHENALALACCIKPGGPATRAVTLEAAHRGWLHTARALPALAATPSGHTMPHQCLISKLRVSAVQHEGTKPLSKQMPESPALRGKLFFCSRAFLCEQTEVRCTKDNGKPARNPRKFPQGHCHLEGTWSCESTSARSVTRRPWFRRRKEKRTAAENRKRRSVTVIGGCSHDNFFAHDLRPARVRSQCTCSLRCSCRLGPPRGDGVEGKLKQRAGEGPLRRDGNDAAPTRLGHMPPAVLQFAPLVLLTKQ